MYPISGCGLFGGDEENVPPPPPDPLAPLLAEALSLAGAHEAAAAAFPELAERLTPVAQAHREHATALAAIVRTPEPTATASPEASASPVAGDAKSTLAALRSAEQKGQKAAAQACHAAPPERAALVGSIAAARATHLEVVR
ncbi:hypothetical protein [Phytohabitans kaempferiae]|uniref:DUF4439 domain-containing protein n=1 Tax=Phytohabitans kaempferiae TaxID=1620943 RepID=A0ABV6M530_9ACTN